ncbi:MAG TPA: hypothetical protein VFK65_22775, partial [Candidatus Binatia bacterium]|nr:hypothetical protein [Candidatus Binatia bacterium]
MVKRLRKILSRFVTFKLIALAMMGLDANGVAAQVSKLPTDWYKVVEAGRKEGKVTVSIPASAEMRKQLEDNFRKRFGIEVEVFTARGSTAVRRMADEFKSGVRYFD